MSQAEFEGDNARQAVGIVVDAHPGLRPKFERPLINSPSHPLTSPAANLTGNPLSRVSGLARRDPLMRFLLLDGAKFRGKIIN